MIRTPFRLAGIIAGGALAVASWYANPSWAASSLADRLNEPYLSALHQGAVRLRMAALATPRSGPYEDVRCVFHAHSGLSHDSRVTPEQVVAAAKAAGIRAMLMTEHPTPDRRWYTEGLRGEKDGVLFVPGAELSDGLILWKSDGTGWSPEMKASEVLSLLKPPAVAFIAHAEKRTADADWNLPPFTGMEIYNSHADAVDSGFEKTLTSLKAENPLKLLERLNTLKTYPHEAFASIFDEQVAVLQRWDRLNQDGLTTGRHVPGIAGNDTHQNVGVSLVATEEGVDVKDALGKVVSQIPRKKLPFLLLATLKPGQTILTHTFDPYEVSLHYVSTHVLVRQVTEDALLDAAKSGHAYVAFDWMADPSGFRFWSGDAEMGSELRADDHPMLQVHTNMPCNIRLLRNGQEVARAEDGAELRHEAAQPGVYRVEAWVRISDEQRPWIYSNPIYVK